MTAQRENRLLDVVDRLTIEHVETAPLDGGKKHFQRHDGLIKQLRDAIASDVVGGNGAGKAANERIPLDPDALAKYEQIEQQVGDMFRDWCAGIPGALPEDNLRDWYRVFDNQHRARHVVERDYRSAVDLLEAWASTIEDKLSPATIRELVDEAGQPQPCPDCGMGWFEVVTNWGVDVINGRASRWYEKERRVALTVSYRPDYLGGLSNSFAKCGCCGHIWTGGEIRALAWELEHEQEGSK